MTDIAVQDAHVPATTVRLAAQGDEAAALESKVDQQIWGGRLPQAAMARPEGFERAVQTLRVEGVEELVRVLQAA
jgi:hypothetical protein